MIALIDDIEIGYDDAGIGVPLVLVHGFPHNRTLWSPQVHGLMDRARCIALDLRGFGASSVSPPWSMDRYADDVVALMDVLRVPQAVVAGLSMGGYVALALWRRHPQRVRGLILASTRAGADSPEAREKRLAMMTLARERGSAAVADAMLQGMVGKTTREKNPDVVEGAREMMVASDPEGIAGALQAMMHRPDSTETLPTIDVPVLVVAGDEDALIPVSEARAMHAAIRGSRLEIIANAGHLGNMERPAAFNHVVSEYLAGVTLE
ncbi:MAG TPA: alpha/beta hydrolase [Gemmatimonadaceae bacterium]